jgi:DNA gyrase/topoisomerase IV subunit B
MNNEGQSISKPIDYTEDQIQKIASLVESIHKRPGMYFGDIHILSFVRNLRCIVIDFFEQIGANFFTLELLDGLSVKMSFAELTKPIDNQLIDPNRAWLQYPFIELHFLNLASLQMTYHALDDQDKLLFSQKYEKGLLVEGTKDYQEFQASRLELIFTLDKEMWKIEEPWDYFVILDEFRDLGLVYKEKTFNIIMDTEASKYYNTIHFPQGVKKLLEFEKMQTYGDFFFDGYLGLDHKLVKMELAFCLNEYHHKEPRFYSFINHQRSRELFGVELAAVRQGVSNGIKKYLREKKVTKRYITPQIGGQHLVAAISLQVAEPVFRSPMRYCNLGNLEIIKPISNCIAAFIYDQMEQDEALAEKTIDRVCGYH